MNTSQILILTILVSAVLFLVQGIETRILRADVNKITNVLKQTLNELDKRLG